LLIVPAAVAQGPLVVPVSKPVQHQVTDHVDFTGQTKAVESVDIVARVTGYLTKIAFKEGANVKKDDLLFELDGEPYQVQLELAEHQLATAEAQFDLANKNYERSLELFKKKSVSQQDFEQSKAAKFQAQAQLKMAQVNLKIAKLNLAWTKVTAPIDGKVGQSLLTKGNLVKQDQTVLTTIVSLDPMHVYFEMDELTLQKIKKAVNDGKMKALQSGQVPLEMALQGDNGFPHKGVIDFINNQFDPATGAIAVRGVFANPALKGAGRLMLPGMFVRVRLALGEPYQALLVVDRAIFTDKALKYVYVVDGGNKVQKRVVTTGSLQENGLRVITKGLEAGDWVVVGALQQVKPNLQVQKMPVPMPVLAPAANAEEPPAKSNPPAPKEIDNCK
jgi:multidrug efflux system membrane fusion protein